VKAFPNRRLNSRSVFLFSHTRTRRQRDPRPRRCPPSQKRDRKRAKSALEEKAPAYKGLQRECHGEPCMPIPYPSHTHTPPYPDFPSRFL
jgi:hypothetical protein